MRTLVSAERLASPGYRRQWVRFLRRVAFEATMHDLLVEGRPALALDAIVLTRGDLAEIVRLAEAFARLFQYAAERIAEDPDELIRIGFPWVAAELLAQEPRAPVALGRFDLVQDRQGTWWVLEYNSDTPSGIREAIVADAEVHRWLRPAGCRVNEAMPERVIESFAAVLGDRGGCLGIVTEGGEPEDLAQMVFTRDLVMPRLAELGWDGVIGDVTNLSLRRSRLHLLGRPIDALYRYYPFESMLGDRAFHAIFEAVFAGRLQLLNGLRGFLPQNKGISAWLWTHRDEPALSPGDRELIRCHLPETHWIGDLPLDFDYRDWVLKQVFGREGAEVYFGDRLDPLDWLRCRNWGTFVVQRRIDVQPVAGIGWEGSEPIHCERFASVGAFVAKGRFAGCYTRVGDRVVSNTALWYATFVEGNDWALLQSQYS